jgi:uncharacterized membrane protein YraQ (UPF0718 family)
MIGETIAVVFFLALVVERIIEATMTTDKVKEWRPLAAPLLGLVVAGTFGVDLFSMLGIQAVIPVVPSLLTGVIIGLGSHFVHDVLSYTANKSATAKETADLWSEANEDVRNGETAQ